MNRNDDYMTGLSSSQLPRISTAQFAQRNGRVRRIKLKSLASICSLIDQNPTKSTTSKMLKSSLNNPIKSFRMPHEHAALSQKRMGYFGQNKQLCLNARSVWTACVKQSLALRINTKKNWTRSLPTHQIIIVSSLSFSRNSENLLNWKIIVQNHRFA